MIHNGEFNDYGYFRDVSVEFIGHCLRNSFNISSIITARSEFIVSDHYAHKKSLEIEAEQRTYREIGMTKKNATHQNELDILNIEKWNNSSKVILRTTRIDSFVLSPIRCNMRSNLGHFLTSHWSLPFASFYFQNFFTREAINSKEFFVGLC